MTRALAFLYSILCYLLFLGAFLYSIGFVGNLIVPRSVDNALESPLGAALFINALLLGAFAVQHSIMARPWFKKVWTRIIPEPIERSTYVLFTCVVMALLFWQWHHLPTDIWVVEHAIGKPVLQALFWIGWLVVLLSTFMINHFDLFGLRQGWLYLTGKPYTPPRFRVTGLYKWVRHPLMLGFIIAMWATPHMTLGHLVFAIGTTGYIIVGIILEEIDLLTTLGEDYRQYRGQVSMLIPWIPKKKPSGPSAGKAPAEQPGAAG